MCVILGLDNTVSVTVTLRQCEETIFLTQFPTLFKVFAILLVLFKSYYYVLALNLSKASGQALRSWRVKQENAFS